MNWTEREWRAVTDAYFEMLAKQDRGEAFVKAHLVAELRAGPLPARTKGAVEKVFGNISAILAEFQREWVVGYVPYSRYAAGLKVVVDSRARARPPDEDVFPTDDLEQLDERVGRLLARRGLLPPVGNPHPPVRFVGGVRRVTRDPTVRAWILLAADGLCARCRLKAPFQTMRGLPYLEHHHLHMLAEGGPDVPANSLAACPNCHRFLHFGRDRAPEIERLLARGHPRRAG